ncbi:MAG: transglutaminase family protein [Micropruina sp.]
MTGLLPIIVEGEAPPAVVQDIADAPRSALCVEERGRPAVRLPAAADQAEDCPLELLSVVESAAVELPVVLRATRCRSTCAPRPSRSPRSGRDRGTPSRRAPGPSNATSPRACTTTPGGPGWQPRSSTGRHPHRHWRRRFTLGGATPADSLLLRRPDLLRSLITYWQHHPSLSYVFSGRFIGPTSQALAGGRGPSRDSCTGVGDCVHRARPGGGRGRGVRAAVGGLALPWNTDWLLRHLLTDLTGNTHRSEFCIDKLYSPTRSGDGSGCPSRAASRCRRTPGWRWCRRCRCAALVAMFLARPYRGRQIRWGTRLHDRFLLPAFAASDLREVVADINEWLAEAAPGVRFDPAWLDPFLPVSRPGETTVAGVHLELRQAIEPWHVLGEEATAGGTARYVDSSVERVQLAASGLLEGRHVLTCNGVPVPLTAVEHGGWGTALGSDDAPAAPACSSASGTGRGRPGRHCTPRWGCIRRCGSEVVDTWNSRSLGGFTYHVVHPGAATTTPTRSTRSRRNSPGRPVQRPGHTAGLIDTPSLAGPRAGKFGPMGTEYPCTLDLSLQPGHPDLSLGPASS